MPTGSISVCGVNRRRHQERIANGWRPIEGCHGTAGALSLRSDPEGAPDGGQEGGPGVARPLLARRGRESLAARLEADLALGEARGDVVGDPGTGGEERTEGDA